MGTGATSRDIAALVGARIEALRIERGLSLRALAQKTGCFTTHLSLIEYGLGSCTVVTLGKVARALRVRPFDLLNHTPENDDMGYIVEVTRRDPKMRAMVKARVGTWKAAGRKARKLAL